MIPCKRYCFHLFRSALTYMQQKQSGEIKGISTEKEGVRKG